MTWTYTDSSGNTTIRDGEVDLVAAYRAARDAYYAACAREDAAFNRYFQKRVARERTNGAALSRLSNRTNYASAELADAQGRLYTLDIDPWDIDDQDGVERSPVGGSAYS